ncbi:MAG: TM2 domain-containing protein [Bryobacterales bacterium]
MSEESDRLQLEDPQAEEVAGEDAASEEPKQETVYCPQCGASMRAADRFCGGCGWDAETWNTSEPGPARREPPPTPRRTAPPSDRNRLTVFLLCLLLGFLGAHRFYAGRNGSGVLWLLTFGIFAVGWIYDLVLIATGEFVDDEGKRIVYWQ